ncbi:MAG TPA: choice-of-anchor L domain-containing protein [Chitinophagales bacterium]|nr:choice-of-anchor L domain-containing protein [Chitinophagales bacterium]HRK27020.1 choice-of-anchor L domain-containing protein [Chitinophagales bacterium]
MLSSFTPPFSWRTGLFALLCLVFTLQMKAQLQVFPGTPPEEMVNLLTGGGVTVSNITLNCPTGAYGTFNGLASNIGIENGIMLATGPLNIAVGPNISGSAGENNGGPGYPLLTDLAGFETFNACVLEFDIIPEGNVLSFNYVFGSEEYNEFVCSGFNDAFAFFVTGANPSGPDYNNSNVALIPGTTIPVAINSVNNGTPGGAYPPSDCISLAYSDYFVDNAGGISVQYDGFTVVLTATVEVIPGEIYHFILGIADAGDGAWDSGVFLQAGSFVSLPEFSLSPPTTAIEGCVDATVTIFMNEPQVTDTAIPLLYGGTATAGADYLLLPNVVVIPAGQTSATLTIVTLADGFPDPGETIVISLAETGQATTVTILEPDLPVVNLGPDGLICPEQNITLSAANLGAVSYEWQDGSANPSFTVTAPGTYSVTVTAQCGTASDEITFTTEPSLNVSLGNDISTCTPVTLDATTPGALNYQWSNGATTPTISAAAGGTYSVTVSNNCGTASDAINVIFGGGVTVNLGPNQTLCLEEVNVLNAFDPDATGYLWSTGSTDEAITVTQTGVYSVTVTSLCGTGTSEVCITLESCDVACNSMTITEIVDCTTNTPDTYVVFASVAGGTAPYSISGSYSGNIDQDNNVISFGPLPYNSFYTLNITDAAGCVRSILGKPVCSTLPVSLTEFNGRTQETNNLLWWHTATEVNNHHFTLHRSADGVQFTHLATLPGAGNTATPKYYEFTDEKPLNGANYYRLMQTDFDGQTQVVGSLLLNRLHSENQANVPITVMPTITTGSIQVFINTPIENARLKLYDTAGKLLADKTLQANQTNASFDLQNYPDGLYLLHYIANHQTYSVKVLKQ